MLISEYTMLTIQVMRWNPQAGSCWGHSGVSLEEPRTGRHHWKESKVTHPTEEAPQKPDPEGTRMRRA